MRIIAVDDEPLQLETLMDYLQELYPKTEVRGFTRVSEALAYIEREPVDVAVLDISMPGNINGISLGELLRLKNKRVKLLYCTGYSDYAMDAFRIHANGYLRKPVRKEELAKELRYVLQMPVFGQDEKPSVHTFGNFDIFVGNRPVVFRRSKSKETLAWLIDREGAWVTNRELAAVLWEDSEGEVDAAKYITTVVGDMVADLQNAGIGHIVERQRGVIRLRRDAVDCDYYALLAGDKEAKTQFRQEYMSQYSWGEETLGFILRNRNGE